MKTSLLILLLLTATAQAAQPKLPITTASYSNKSVDGKAGINPYPWDYANSHGVKPDPHGPDTAQVADGLILTGDELDSDHVKVSQVAGTGITQAGQTSTLDYFRVTSAINGYNLTGTDCHVGHGFIKNIVKDAFTVSGGGNDFLSSLHAWGGDRGFVIGSRVIFPGGCYADNERIGFVFNGNAHGSRGLMVLSGCWECGASIEVNGVNLSFMGDVPAATADHPNPFGINIAANTVHNTFDGFLMVGEGGTGIIARGNKLRIRIEGGGWNAPQKNSTLLKLDGPMHDCKFDVRCVCNGGNIVDRSSAQLDDSCSVNIAD